jgi:hypothetical protein
MELHAIQSKQASMSLGRTFWFGTGKTLISSVLDFLTRCRLNTIGRAPSFRLAEGSLSALPCVVQ